MVEAGGGVVDDSRGLLGVDHIGRQLIDDRRRTKRQLPIGIDSKIVTVANSAGVGVNAPLGTKGVAGDGVVRPEGDSGVWAGRISSLIYE
jgi:hypothetical protein